MLECRRRWSHFRSPRYRFIKVTMITRELSPPIVSDRSDSTPPENQNGEPYGSIDRVVGERQSWIWGLMCLRWLGLMVDCLGMFLQIVR